MPPAQKPHEAKIAERRKQLLRSIGKGKTIPAISKELGINQGTLFWDIRILKKRMKPEAAARLRARIVSNIATKFGLGRATDIISLARKIIKGEAVISSEPRKPWLTYIDKHPNKANQILKELRSTKKTIRQIAKQTGASCHVVREAYNALRAKRAKIPTRMRGVIKDEGRITGVLKQKQINGIMNLQDKKIVAVSKRFYYYYKPLFAGAAMDWEDIAQHIRKELPWKLLTFNPAAWNGATLNQKVERCCSRQIRLLALDMKRAGGRAFRQKQSLEKPVHGTKAEGKETRLKDIIPLKEPTPSLDPQEIIAAIETISKKAALTKQQKAVVYGKAAGIIQRQIAEMANVTESLVSYLWSAVKIKLSKAGITH